MSTERIGVIVKGMAFVYMVSAAQHDAQAAGKTAALRDAVMPTLRQFRQDGDPHPVVDAILSVLGKDWEPTGEFREAIERLGVVG